MNREVRTVVLAAAVLVLSGCAASEASEPAPSTPAAPTASSLPCQPMTTVPECSDILTDVVLTAGASFDALADPTAEQVRADITLDHAGAKWASTCRLETGLLVAEVEPACEQIIRDLSDAAVLIDPSIDD